MLGHIRIITNTVHVSMGMTTAHAVHATHEDTANDTQSIRQPFIIPLGVWLPHPEGRSFLARGCFSPETLTVVLGGLDPKRPSAIDYVTNAMQKRPGEMINAVRKSSL